MKNNFHLSSPWHFSHRRTIQISLIIIGFYRFLDNFQNGIPLFNKLYDFKICNFNTDLNSELMGSITLYLIAIFPKLRFRSLCCSVCIFRFNCVTLQLNLDQHVLVLELHLSYSENNDNISVIVVFLLQFRLNIERFRDTYVYECCARSFFEFIWEYVFGIFIGKIVFSFGFEENL